MKTICVPVVRTMGGPMEELLVAEYEGDVDIYSGGGSHYDFHDGKIIKAGVGILQNSICDIMIFLFFHV